MLTADATLDQRDLLPEQPSPIQSVAHNSAEPVTSAIKALRSEQSENEISSQALTTLLSDHQTVSLSLRLASYAKVQLAAAAVAAPAVAAEQLILPLLLPLLQ